MCRIASIYDLRELADPQNSHFIAGMTDSLAHGGPDGFGATTLAGGRLHLGHRRLSILELSELGTQPMQYEDLTTIFNGEIYNFKEVRLELQALGYQFVTDSDTEVVLKAFKQWRTDCFKMFHGMFAIVLWDATSEEMFIVRDRLGVKPLYVYEREGLMMISSELKAFHKHTGFVKDIDHEAVKEYLHFGYINSPRSIFKFVRKQLPGHITIVRSDATKSSICYYSPLIPEVPWYDGATPEEVVDKCEQLLQKAFNYRMVADVPVGMFLSGGIDSSLTAALLAKSGTEKLQTFTIGFREVEYDEAPYAKDIAQLLGTEHREYYCTEQDFLEVIPLLPNIYDEPFGDSSAIPTYIVSKFASKYVKVVLSADGGDEIFGGYLRYQHMHQSASRLLSLPLWMRRSIAQLVEMTPLGLLKAALKIFRPSVSTTGLDWKIAKLINTLQAGSREEVFQRSAMVMGPELVSSLFRGSEPSYSFEPLRLAPPGTLVGSMGLYDLKTYLEGDVLTKVDRATMRCAIEGREPFLDQDVIEFGTSIADRWKLQDGKSKWITRKLLERYIPKKMIDRPKAGFSVPIGKWLRGSLRSELLEMACDINFIDRYELRQDSVRVFIQDFLNGDNKVNPNAVWTIFMLFKWDQEWMQQH